MSRIIRAAQLAARVHYGQQRKFSRRPGITHPAEVATVVATHTRADELTVCGAWLHDVIEDFTGDVDAPEGTDPKLVIRRRIAAQCGKDVLKLVEELTNPSKDHPGLKRAERKAMDRDHLAGASWEARFIKLADRACNVREATRDCMNSVAYDKTFGPTTAEQIKFLKLYLSESRLLLNEALRGVDAQLEDELDEANGHAHAILRYLSPNLGLPETDHA